MSVEEERQLLAESQQKGTLATLGTYAKLSGPGWLQSAITLGGGSLASSLFLGVLAGFSMLWLQPLAMVLGVIMLSAIGYVTLSTGERPFQAINRYVNPVLGWSWALASLLASMVWCLPQYNLANSVLQQNLLPGLLGEGSDLENTLVMGFPFSKLLIAGVILVITTLVTWSYDSGSWGIRLYELVLKIMVAMIVLCFFAVVFRLTFAEDALNWSEIFAGFVPDFSLLYTPASGFGAFLEKIPEQHQAFWGNLIVSKQRDVMFSAAATAVGINMTFLLPYSLLRKGWSKEFRGLLSFDLATGMFIPFVLATSCVIIASASQFHPRPEKLDDRIAQKVQITEDLAKDEKEKVKFQISKKLIGSYEKQLESFQNENGEGTTLSETPIKLSNAEKHLALALVNKQSSDLAQSLGDLTGKTIADIIFGLGVLGMTLSTITILMLISGMVICEIFNVPLSGWPHRLGTLAAATGVLGPFLWGKLGFYLAVPTSVFGLMLLPIAYLTFFLLMNQKTLLKDQMPTGGSRILWNVLMFIAAGTATCASVYAIWQKTEWYGIGAVALLLGLALAVQFTRKKPALPDIPPEDKGDNDMAS